MQRVAQERRLSGGKEKALPEVETNGRALCTGRTPLKPELGSIIAGSMAKEKPAGVRSSGLRSSVLLTDQGFC